METTIIDRIIEAIKEGRDITVDIDGEEIILDSKEKVRIMKEYD